LYNDKVQKTFLVALESSEERDELFESLGARNTTGSSFGKRKKKISSTSTEREILDCRFFGRC